LPVLCPDEINHRKGEIVGVYHDPVHGTCTVTGFCNGQLMLLTAVFGHVVIPSETLVLFPHRWVKPEGENHA